MNDKKLEVKWQEICAHEDSVLAKMREYVKPFNDELSSYGIKVVARLLWYYPDDKDLTFERKPIRRKVAYICSINVAICPTDIDLKDVTIEESRGISLNDWASSYGLSIWRGWCFSKGNGNYIYKNLKSICDDVKNHGIEYAVNKYLAVDDDK